jgi:hypothetical protein
MHFGPREEDATAQIYPCISLPPTYLISVHPPLADTRTARGGIWTTSSSSDWRSLKYEEIFLKAYGSPAEARSGIGACG